MLIETGLTTPQIAYYVERLYALGGGVPHGYIVRCVSFSNPRHPKSVAATVTDLEAQAIARQRAELWAAQFAGAGHCAHLVEEPIPPQWRQRSGFSSAPPHWTGWVVFIEPPSARQQMNQAEPVGETGSIMFLERILP